MERDPYDILGISRYSTEEDIKKAYRDLAKRYHPDNFTDESMRRLAEEKMKEINEAYDEILRQRASGAKGTNYDTGSDYSDALADARRKITESKFVEADLVLESIEQNSRNAEWHYLKACVFASRGAYADALKYSNMACNMAPNNGEYKIFRDNLQNPRHFPPFPPQRTATFHLTNLYLNF